MCLKSKELCRSHRFIANPNGYLQYLNFYYLSKYVLHLDNMYIIIFKHKILSLHPSLVMSYCDNGAFIMTSIYNIGNYQSHMNKGSQLSIVY